MADEPTADEGSEQTPKRRRKRSDAAKRLVPRPDDKFKDGTRRGARRPPAASPTHPTRLLARQRQREALELRLAGVSFPDIAKQLGYKSVEGARQAVLRAQKERLPEMTHDLRMMQYERLNHMLMTLWPQVNAGSERAISVALSVMDKIDRLFGTEAPQQIEVKGKVGVITIDGDKQEYLLKLRAMAGDPEALEQAKQMELEAKNKTDVEEPLIETTAVEPMADVVAQEAYGPPDDD